MLSAPGSEWLYARLYPAAPEHVEDLLTRVVAPVSAGPSVAAAERWFWLRYLDHVGVHVRFRVLAAPSVVERVLDDVERRLPDGAVVTLGVYEPEHDVYGGPSGVTAAERRFQLSSRLCLDLVDAVPQGAARLAAAAGLMRAAAEQLPEPEGTTFLRDTAAYWQTPAGPAPAPVRAGARAAGPAWSPACAPLVAGWLADLDLPEELRGRAGAPSAAAWRFRLVHLTMNRLGIAPREEGALAAELAAALG